MRLSPVFPGLGVPELLMQILVVEQSQTWFLSQGSATGEHCHSLI